MSALFSPCRTWRYVLVRRTQDRLTDWVASTHGMARTVAFVGLNPSTADETVNDPTVTRCVGFAKRWGYERMVMLNLFAYRSTDPRGLRDPLDAVGPQNDYYLLKECERADLVVCAWGVHGAMVPRLSRKPTTPRGKQVTSMLRSELGVELHVLGLTKDGHPKHPLYLRGDTPLVPFMAS